MLDHDYVVPKLGRGPDHQHYDYRPLNESRPKLHWPNQAPVALCVIITLEHLEWEPPEGSYISPSLSGGYGNRPHPDVTRWSHREYGHRVGVFRILEVLERHGITPTVAMDVLTARHYPFVAKHCLKIGAELIGHGYSVNRMITSRMTVNEERSHITESLATLRDLTGSTPQGWLGPEYGESPRTPALLAEAGVRYLCDWVNDEQPYVLKVPKGKLYALPVTYPLDDVEALWDRRLEVGRWGRMIVEAFTQLRKDGARNGRLLVLNLHPWMTGQAFRIKHLDQALGQVLSSEATWTATGSQIVNWYAQQVHKEEAAD